MNGKVHPADRMTSRERLLAAYRGREVDRLPYWAKVANSTWRSSQPADVLAMSQRELLDYIFADGLFGASCGVRAVRPHIRVDESRTPREITRVTHTPDGDLQERWAIDEATRSSHPVEFPVKCVEDLRRWRWVHTDVRAEIDQAAREKTDQLVRDIGERGVVLTSWGTSPLMDLVEHVIGPVETHMMLADNTGEMDELIGLMHAANLRIVEAIAQSTPADIVVSIENTSTTLISPTQFDRYCFGHLCDYGRAIEAAGKMHELHMCGHLLKVLPRIDAIPACSIEAFTSPTLGSTRLADGRRLSPSKTLIGGTNVNTWLEPPQRIREYIQSELDACPDHRRVILTTAGVAPPACSAHTFRQIGQWIPSVPVRM